MANYVDGGGVYENQDTAAADTARRFETDNIMLRDVVIKVSTKAQLFGDSANQRFEVGINESIYFTMINISTLYFKNKDAGQNGVVNIVGVRD